MLFNRIGTRVAVGLFLMLLATPAWAQGLSGLQLFAPPEVPPYGEAPKASEGFFFSYEGLYWAVSAPKVVPVGNQTIPTRDAYWGPFNNDLVVQTNSLNTSFLSAKFEPGQRWEIGRMDDHSGWMIGVSQMQDQDELFSFQNVQMVVNDPPFGPGPEQLLNGNVLVPPAILNRPLPLVWDTLAGQNSTRLWNVELMYIYRTSQFHDGGYCEFFIGPRYFEFDDSFNVNATGGILGDAMWDTNAQNHVIAGQVGARWFRSVGRWMINAEGRFWAGLDCQNLTTGGVLATNANPGTTATGEATLLAPIAFQHSVFDREFNPGVELRLNASYKLTRFISIKAGWTGMWMDRCARASGLLDYSVQRSAEGLPAGFDILPGTNRQTVWINGFTFGLEVNR
jgi:hypothetical protein